MVADVVQHEYTSATKCDLNLAFAYFVLHGIDSVAEHLQQ